METSMHNCLQKQNSAQCVTEQIRCEKNKLFHLNACQSSRERQIIRRIDSLKNGQSRVPETNHVWSMKKPQTLSNYKPGKNVKYKMTFNFLNRKSNYHMNELGGLHP